MHGVFLDAASVDRGDLDLTRLRETLESWAIHDSTTPDRLAGRIAEADVIVTNKVRLGEEEMALAPRLRLVALTATGYNNIDLEAARRRGVAVSNIRAYCTPSVVQHTFALILALRTRMDDYRRLVREGGWARAEQFCPLDFTIHELHGETLGIIGHGELGRAVAAVGRAFGMEVVTARRPGRTAAEDPRPDLDELLPHLDVLTLHLPLTPENHHLIDRRRLERLPEGALLINTARGALVDEAALADVLRAGHLGGAGIDVLSEEPPRHGNPLLADDIPNLIVTPHVAWAAVEARQRAIDQVADNIRNFLEGRPCNRVDV